MKTLIKSTLTTVLIFGSLSTFATPGNPLKNNGIKKWVSEHVSYPSSAAENHEEGTVYVYFELLNGQPVNISVIQGVTKSLNQAAINAVQEMPASEWAKFAPFEENKYILPFKFEIK